MIFDNLLRATYVQGVKLNDPRLIEMFGGGSQSHAGESVTPRSALTCSAVYGAIRILSGIHAILPNILYQRLKDGGRARAVNHPVYRILANTPNGSWNPGDFRRFIAVCLNLRGNAYAWIQFNMAGRPMGIWPLHPDYVYPKLNSDGSITYEVHLRSGQPKEYPQNEILHFRGPSEDGLTGMSPISYARHIIGKGLALDRFSGRFFGNGINPAGVLQHPAVIGKEAQERLVSQVEKKYSGGVNSHRPLLLEEGMTWNKISVNPEEAQFLETMGFTAVEIGTGIFGVAPHLLGITEKVTSWGTGLFEQVMNMLNFTLTPQHVCIEEELSRKLLTPEEQNEYYIETLIDALMRADPKARAEYYRTMQTMGNMTQNEVREKENFNPIDNPLANEPMIQANMIPLSKAGQSQPEVKPPAESGSGQNGQENETETE